MQLGHHRRDLLPADPSGVVGLQLDPQALLEAGDPAEVPVLRPPVQRLRVLGSDLLLGDWEPSKNERDGCTEVLRHEPDWLQTWNQQPQVKVAGRLVLGHEADSALIEVECRHRSL